MIVAADRGCQLAPASNDMALRISQASRTATEAQLARGPFWLGAAGAAVGQGCTAAAYSHRQTACTQGAAHAERLVHDSSMPCLSCVPAGYTVALALALEARLEASARLALGWRLVLGWRSAGARMH